MLIVITGANSGIGRAAALRLARAGHTVVATTRSLDRAAKVAETARAEGLDLHLATLDVGSDESVASCFAGIEADHGVPDVLVNNSGVGSNFSLEDAPMSEWQAVYDTNVFGAVRCTQAVLPGMRQRGSGHICMISSVVGRFAAVGQAVYTSSKWAMEGMAETLALEVRRFGISVSIVEPGVTRTAILAKNTEAPAGAYAGAYRRMFAMYQSLIPHAPPAEAAAEVIEAAIGSDGSQLRWRSGADAEALLSAREQMSDAEFLALGDPDDEAYRAAWRDHFGIDLDVWTPEN